MSHSGLTNQKLEGKGVLVLHFTESPVQGLGQGGEQCREGMMCMQRISMGGDDSLPSVMFGQPSFQQPQVVGLPMLVSFTSSLEVADLNFWGFTELSLWDTLVLSSGLEVQKNSQFPNHVMIPIS